MTAYELAKEMDDACIEFVGDVWIPTFKSVASMLRQQADRIAELEKKCEPVAWMNIRTSKCVVFINTPPSNDWIPLFTTPQTKPLSDEEIYELLDKCIDSPDDGFEFRYKDYARAIEERHGIK